MSIHPEILDLIHAELDGVATQAEQLRLRGAIAADPAVRDEYRRLRGLNDLLAQVAPSDAPAGLAPSVMREVRARRAGANYGIADRVRVAWPGGRVALRYAYAVAAGAVIALFCVQLASGGSFFGPVVPERYAGATIAPSHRAIHLDLAPAGVPGIATLEPSASGAAIGLDLHGNEPVELVLRYDPVKDGGRVQVLVMRDGEATEAGSLTLLHKN